MYLPNNTLLQGGKYKIVRFISAGGFGCTYEAEHVMLHKKVAIKEFFVKDFCNRDETSSKISVGITSKTALVSKLRKKFIEEAQSVCALKHANIVNVSDVFEENGTSYYVMDYINGPSLNELVKKVGPLTEQRAVGYILQVAEALKYVHSQNRLHLDIKPGNIMIDENDKAILIDFGASKQYDEVDGENTSTLLGKTPGYAPLEQMGNDVVKFLPSTDIYALGATLYKILTGNTPPSATLLASGESLDFPSSITERTRNAITMSMKTNKKERPQSVDEFEKLLQAQQVDDDSTVLEAECRIKENPRDREKEPLHETPSSKKNGIAGEGSKGTRTESNPVDKRPSPKSVLKSIFLLVAGAVGIGILVWIIGNRWNTPNEEQTTQEAANKNSVLVSEVHEYVDLGLPSGTKWATCNVGAANPWDFGDYYAWGETETKSEYKLSTYLGGSMSSEDDCGTSKDPLQSYVYPNQKSIAGTDYDVAYVKWGGTWKMPTLAQIEELYNSKYCTTEWTGNYKGTGVSGRIITSKVKGYVGNFIFLPAAGCRDDSSLLLEGSYGYYWSATPDSNGADNAYDLIFDSGDIYWGIGSRFYAQSVRPVSK